MIYGDELRSTGFTLNGNKLYYDYSDFEELRADVYEHDCADGTKALKISNLRIANPMEEGTCHVLFAYSLYYRKIKDFYDLLRLMNYPIREETSFILNNEKLVECLENSEKKFLK